MKKEKKESNGFARVLIGIIILAVIAGFYQSSLSKKTSNVHKEEVIYKFDKEQSLSLSEIQYMIQVTEDVLEKEPNNEEIKSQLQYWKSLEKKVRDTQNKPKDRYIIIDIKVEHE